jgi:hypothetical protein
VTNGEDPGAGANDDSLSDAEGASGTMPAPPPVATSDGPDDPLRRHERIVRRATIVIASAAVLNFLVALFNLLVAWAQWDVARVTSAAVQKSSTAAETSAAAAKEALAMADQTRRAQIEPAIVLTYEHFKKEIVVGNEGSEPVVNLSVVADTAVILGPPHNKPIGKQIGSRPIPGERPAAWWHVAKLEAGAVQRKSISDIADNAAHLVRIHEESRRRGTLILPPPAAALYSVIAFQLTYHRAVDRKRYPVIAKRITVYADANGYSAWVGNLFTMMPPVDIEKR